MMYHKYSQLDVDIIPIGRYACQNLIWLVSGAFGRLLVSHCCSVSGFVGYEGVKYELFSGNFFSARTLYGGGCVVNVATLQFRMAPWKPCLTNIFKRE